MKKILFYLTAVLVWTTSANAQLHYKDTVNPEILRHTNRYSPCRHEIILPVVNGYNLYKADLHTHTLCSDGNVLPDFRISEAWQDGLDIVAITDHLEWRPHDETMAEYILGTSEGVKNNRISYNPPDEDGILVDLNYSYERAMKWAPEFGITVIRGIEISRDGATVGHYNALFTTDNNKIYHPDPLVSIRNAKAQGALVMHNHPGWRKKDVTMTKVDRVAYGEGLIDGVEVMNESDFYPSIIDRANEYGIFMSSGSDIHGSAIAEYLPGGNRRPMNFILAEDMSMDSLKEALKARRTIAYGFGTMCADEQLLKDFFGASVELKVATERTSDEKILLWLVNRTSVPFYLSFDGGNPVLLAPFSSIRLKRNSEERRLEFAVINMFYSKDAHPVVTMFF